MDENDEASGSCDTQSSDEIETGAEWKNVVDEESSIFKTLTVAQIENKMNQYIDDAIEYIKPNVSVS